MFGKLFMKLSDDIAENEREGLRRSILADNLRRGSVMAAVIIGLEVCLAAADITTSILKVDDRFHFSLYLAMYLLMILVNAIFILFARRQRDVAAVSAARLGRLERRVVGYAAFMAAWGSFITLMDQRLYGQLTVFMVNTIIVSLLFYMNDRQVLVTNGLSVAIVAAGLPFFQHSSDVLIGHYVNLAIFLFVVWVTSKITYHRRCSEYKSRMLLMEANGKLAQESERNKQTNLLLADANRQLRVLSLVDELTGIPNRRSFRNYIDTMLSSLMRQDMPFSVIMLDLDCFKEYNDNYGHSQADTALAAVAGQLQSLVRHNMDIAARWGGEEFIYAAFGMDEGQAGEMAERIRHKIMALQIPHLFSRAHEVITVSAGCSTVTLAGKDDVSRCIEQADKAMYRAKAEGRNLTRVG